jgi:predicted alpha-1,2-mannosidase
VWNNKVLSKITTTETNPTDLQNIYTSLYIMHQSPSNRTGENPGWISQEPYFDDIFTMWDLFRTSMPLMHILQPIAYEQLLRSMVDVWRNSGYLPNTRSVNYNGPVQGGSNADIVLGDAYVKGVRGAVNWKDAFAAMVNDAEVTPKNNFDPRANDSSTKEGRGALPDWLDLGFITPDFSRSVSRGIEYALDDFALYQVALGEANDAESTKYWVRSQNWRNFWNPAATSLGFQGFVGPRNRSAFIPHDPLQGGGYWADPLYQGSAWEYSFNAHHDVAALVELCGGPDTFVSRLRMLFEHQIDPENPDARMYSMSLFLLEILDQVLTFSADPANQVSFTSPYLFHFAARPDLSISTSRKIAREKFSPTPKGLPGNADSGAMQSWLLWNMIGLFPLPAQTTFLIHSPWFEHLSIDLGRGKSLVINSTGGNKDIAIHVQSLKINGQDWRRSWLTWNDVFAEGGVMEFELGPNPNSGWFDAEDLPPSPASAASPPAANIEVRIETVEVGARPPSREGLVAVPKTQEQRDRRRWYPLLSLLILVPIIGLGIYIFSRSRMAVKKHGTFAIRPPRESTGIIEEESGGAAGQSPP